MLVLIVLISVVPIAIEFLRARSKAKKEAAAQGGESQGHGPVAGGGSAARGPARPPRQALTRRGDRVRHRAVRSRASAWPRGGSPRRPLPAPA